MEEASSKGKAARVTFEVTGAVCYCVGGEASWRPPINAYRRSGAYVICLELAGVDRLGVDLSVEPRKVRIRGRRPPPEPPEFEGPTLQILAYEIDHGPFEREVDLPEEVEPLGTLAEQRNGLLWIYLPLRAPG